MSTEVKKETPSNEEEVVLAIPDEEESSDSDAQDKKRDALSHQPDKYPMRYVSCTIFGSELSLNPFTSLFGFAFLWGISVWCMATPSEADARLGEWSDAVTAKVCFVARHQSCVLYSRYPRQTKSFVFSVCFVQFTWFYIVANPSFTFFVFWLAYQYGDVKYVCRRCHYALTLVKRIAGSLLTLCRQLQAWKEGRQARIRRSIVLYDALFGWCSRGSLFLRSRRTLVASPVELVRRSGIPFTR